jgi:hypothetical protein
MDHANCRCALIRTAEPDFPPGPHYAVDYCRTALPDGRVHVERAVHCIDRSGEKDTFVDEWVEGAPK